MYRAIVVHSTCFTVFDKRLQAIATVCKPRNLEALRNNLPEMQRIVILLLSH